MGKEIVKKNTPWEICEIGGRKIYVKREDLCCPSPGPEFSKVRGIEKQIQTLLGGLVVPTRFGVVDSVHSKAGWGVAYICQQLRVPCTVFYPVMKSEDPGHIRVFQKKAQSFGAELIGLPATMSSVLFYQARRIFREKYPEGYMFPNGLKLENTIKETAKEVYHNTPDELLTQKAVWVVSVSSGTIAAGVVSGLSLRGFRGTVILHMGFSRSESGMLQYMYKHATTDINLKVIDEGYEYKDVVEYPAPFPCNPFYDRKAWKWLVENMEAQGLTDPICFWNIGR